MANPYQPPETVSAGPETGNKLTIPQILFSFHGRIRRSTFWRWLILSYVTVLGFDLGASLLLREAGVGDLTANRIIILITMIPFCWVFMALQIKRWHDLNKSGWWALITVIPYLGPLWMFIENGCLDGTVGENDYGPDPKGRIPLSV